MQELEDIFTILHDAGIDAYELTNEGLQLKVGIRYLAQLIEPNHECIHLSFKGLTDFYIKLWDDDDSILKDLDQIISLDLEVMNAQLLESDLLKVNCHCHSHDIAAPGGELYIKCNGYQLTDQIGNPLQLDDLKRISTSYWNEHFRK